MLKVLNRFVTWIKLWFLTRAINKEIEDSFSSTGANNVVGGGVLGLDGFEVSDEQLQIVQDQKQYKYVQGMTYLKEAINKQIRGNDPEKVLSGYKGEKNFYLGNDLLALATRENDSERKLRKVRTSIVAGNVADVKSAKDKDRMIESRIRDMYGVQESKIQKKLMKEIRQAKNNNDFVRAKVLEEEFNDKYVRKK